MVLVTKTNTVFELSGVLIVDAFVFGGSGGGGGGCFRIYSARIFFHIFFSAV